MDNRHEGAEMDVLSGSECYQLLASRQIGRLGLVAENYPLIIPVNYGLDRDVVVIRTEPDSIVARSEHTNVTFQIDQLDLTKDAGWSVLLRGQAEALSVEHSPEIVERTRATGVEPWAPGERRHWMRIIPHGISGRRITSGKDLQWRLGSAAYM